MATTLHQACLQVRDYDVRWHVNAGLLGLKTLVVKMCSVTLSMAGGLIAGKEGPFIHAGGIVGGGWAGMGSRSVNTQGFACAASSLTWLHSAEYRNEACQEHPTCFVCSHAKP